MHNAILKAITAIVFMIAIVAIAIIDTEFLFPYVHIVLAVCLAYFGLLMYANRDRLQ